MINVNLPTPNFWKCKDLNVNVKSLQSIIEADNFIKINTLPKDKINCHPTFIFLYRISLRNMSHYRLKMGCNCSFMFTFGSPVKERFKKEMLKRINKYKMSWQTILTENGSSKILKYTVQCAAQFDQMWVIWVLHFVYICILHHTQYAHCKNNKSSMVVRYPKHSLSEVHSALKACMNMNLHSMKSHIEKL